MSERTIIEQPWHWGNAAMRVSAIAKATNFEAATPESIAFVQEMIADQANMLAQTAMDRIELTRLRNMILELNERLNQIEGDRAMWKVTAKQLNETLRRQVRSREIGV